MLISQVFPSKYLTAADLNSKPYTLTIKSVTMEEMVTHDNKKVKKPVCWFEKAQKGFVMNVTNARIIAALYGDNTDGWTGKRVTLYPTQVRAFGSLQDAIRVREEIPAQPKPLAQTAVVEEPTGLDDDEDVADFDEATHACVACDDESGSVGAPDDDDDLWEPTPTTNGKRPNLLSQAQLTRIHALGREIYGHEWDGIRPKLVEDVTKGAISSSKELQPGEADVLIRELELKRREQTQPA